jgi:hypothetical protein
MVELDRALRMPEDELVAAWHEREMLIGRRERLACDGREYSGVVEAIEPSGCVVLRMDGQLVRLPAMATSVIKE